MINLDSSASINVRLLRALESPPLVWRTISDLSKQTGVSESEVLIYLRETDDDVVESTYLSEDGQIRYSTRRHLYSNANFWQKLHGFLGDGID